jgi:uncharacterized protein with HEPN domain
MPPDLAKYLQDARQAGDTLAKITAGKSFQDYLADVTLRLAVERLFIIIGEALMQASKSEPSLAASITSLRQVIGFRNVLVHGYAVVQDATVWGIVENDLATLRGEIDTLLATIGPP